MSPSMTSDETVADLASDTLQAALDVFSGPNSTAVPDGGRQKLKELAERHKQAVAKAALLASNSGGPSKKLPDEELKGVVYGVEQAAIALCSFCHAFTADAGPSLKASLRTLCEAVVAPSRELVAKLAYGDAAELRRAVGNVWGACDELCRGPLDNKACLFRQLADVAGAVKGASKELDELIASSREALASTSAASPSRGEGSAAEAKREEGNEEGEEEDDEGEADVEGENDDSDDFRDMGTLDAGELRTAEAAAALLGAAQGALRAVSRPLLEGPPVGSAHCVDEWESMAWHAAKLRSACEGLVACLYPPHDDPEELRGTGEAVSNTLELMLSEVPEPYLLQPPPAAEGGAGPQAAGSGGGAGAVAAHAGLEGVLAAAQAVVDEASGRLGEALARLAPPSPSAAGTAG